MPTYNIWQGGAKKTAGVYHLTPAAPEPGDIFTTTINGKSIAVTASSGSVSTLVADLVEALTAAKEVHPEFNELTFAASDDDTYVVATGPEDGTPVTISTGTTNGGAYTVTVETIVDGVGSGAINEIQELLNVTGAAFGVNTKFRLTGDVSWSSYLYMPSSAAALQAVLESLTSVGAGNVSVTRTGDATTGYDYTVEFISSKAGTDMPAIEYLSQDGVVSGTFDTVRDGASGSINEQQEVTLTGSPAGGTFTLTYDGQTTSGIAYNASAATVKTALEALSNIGSGDVAVDGDAGGPWTVTFQGALAATNVVEMTGSGASLTGGATQTYTTTTSTTPSGPNWFTTAANWSAGTAPVDNETLVFENSDVDCKFGLSNASTTPAGIIVRASFTGQIGLPRYNPLGYYEYRDTELRIGTDGDGSASSIFIDVGQGIGAGSDLLRFNTGDKQTVLTCYLTNVAAPEESSAPSLCWRGTNAANTVDVLKGNVGIGYFLNQSATVATLRMSSLGTVDTDAQVEVGEGATLGTVTKSGGALLAHCGATSLNQTAGAATFDGAGNLTTLVASGGTVIWNSTGTIGKKGTITGASAANPCVITSAAHGLAVGDVVRIGGVVGMTELNQREFTISAVTTDTFTLAGVNSSGYTAYSSGGTWGKIGSVVVSGPALLDFAQSLVAKSVAVAVDIYGDEATVNDPNKIVSTSTYLTGEFARRFRYTSREAAMGVDFIDVRRV